MLRIRFQRIGKKNQPFLRLVVVDKEAPPKGGRFEKLGWWNPLTKERKLEAERVKYWLSVGAQPTGRVYNWLVDEGIVSGEKKAVQARQKKTAEEEKQGSPGKSEEASSKKEEAPAEKKEEERADSSAKKTEEEEKEEVKEKKEEAPQEEKGEEKK